MLTVHIENIGEMAVIECKGRIVRSEAAFTLRNAVTSQQNSRIVVLDLTDVHAIEGGGLGMLCFLQRWAQDQGIELKLFNPIYSVRNRLENEYSTQFHITPFDEMMDLLARADIPHPRAA